MEGTKQGTKQGTNSMMKRIRTTPTPPLTPSPSYISPTAKTKFSSVSALIVLLFRIQPLLAFSALPSLPVATCTGITHAFSVCDQSYYQSHATNKININNDKNIVCYNYCHQQQRRGRSRGRLLLSRGSDTRSRRRAGAASPSSLSATVTVAQDSDYRPSLPPQQEDNGDEKTNLKNSNSNKSNTPQRQKKQLSNSKRRYIVKSKFREAKLLERRGRWNLACQKYDDILDLDPYDAHSHLGLARLQARREKHKHTATSSSKARASFERGTRRCPNSVHLWQAWAVYEESYHDNIDKARHLYKRALEIDAYNPYVCHAYGLMEKKQTQQQEAQQQQQQQLNDGFQQQQQQQQQISNRAQPKELWERALQKTSTAALVCSLGQLFIEQQDYEQARDLYNAHLPQLQNPKDRTEIYLAMAWLEERYNENYTNAHEHLQKALQHFPTSSLVHVALARLEGRRRQQQTGDNKTDGKRAAVQRLANACIQMEQQQTEALINRKDNDKMPHEDGGRLYNAWAHLEVRDRKFDQARRILAKGMERYPNDPMLLQAAGKVEERVGNTTRAHELYGMSLSMEPTAPTLVAYALLELRKPTSETTNYTNHVKELFEEALLLDPRHGPTYNAYGTAELRHGTAKEARGIFQRGVRANCADAASIYHGYANMELSLGNIEAARETLQNGLKEAQLKDVGMDSQHRERAIFLSHTLGMIELNSNRAIEALAVFTDGIGRFGNSSQLLLGAAQCKVKLGKQESARELFEQSVLIDPKHAQAWQAWGVMEMRAGQISTARKLFDGGIKSAPKHGALWQAYATMESRLGEVEKGRSLFISGIKKAPGHVPLYQGWASLELRQDNIVAAKRLLAKALTLDKRNGSGWLIAADVEKRLGNDGLAGLILRRGIECAPSNAELYRALGEHLLHKGEIDNARKIFEKGIEVNPFHAPTYHSLAELEARIFNVEGLAKLNRKATAIFSGNALEPNLSSTAQAWGSNIRARRSNKIPSCVAALAEKIVEDDKVTYTSEEDLDPFAALETMRSSSLIEEELLGSLLQNEQQNPKE